MRSLASVHSTKAVIQPAARVPRIPKRAATLNRAAVTDEAPMDAVETQKRDLQAMLNKPYKYGFKTIIESDTFPKGLSEDVVRAISLKKNEPEWLLDFRLKAYRKWLSMAEPKWSDNEYPAIDYQDLSYYSEPKQKPKKQSLDEVDPDLLATFAKLGIPLNEQKRLSNVAVDAVFDSVSIATTFRKELAEVGVIFCSFSEAVKEFPDIVRKHLGSVVRPQCYLFYLFVEDVFLLHLLIACWRKQCTPLMLRSSGCACSNKKRDAFLNNLTLLC